jgi:hypothetical protein
MQTWLFATAFAGYVQALSTAAIIGSIWAEFDRSRQIKQTETFKELSGVHTAVFLIFASTYPLIWIFAIYAWRAVFFFLSVETEFVINQTNQLQQSKSFKTSQSSLKSQESRNKLSGKSLTHSKSISQELAPALDAYEESQHSTFKELSTVPEDDEELVPWPLEPSILHSSELFEEQDSTRINDDPSLISKNNDLLAETISQEKIAVQKSKTRLETDSQSSKQASLSVASKEIEIANTENSLVGLQDDEMVERENIAKVVDDYFVQEGMKKHIKDGPTSPDPSTDEQPSKSKTREGPKPKVEPNKEAIEELVNNWFASNNSSTDTREQDAKKIYQDWMKKTAK